MKTPSRQPQVAHASKVYAVTGASSGIGLAVTRALLVAGHEVHALARRDALIREGCSTLDSEQQARLHPASVDVADLDAVQSWRRSMKYPINGLICAAGVNITNRAFPDLTPADWKNVVDVNLNGVYHVVQAVIDGIADSQGDVIIVSSVAALWPDHTGAAYQAAKAGLVALGRALAHDYHWRGVRVCTVLPGMVDTPALDKRPTPPSREVRDLLMRPEDIADACSAILALPHQVTVSEITLMPTLISSLGHAQSATATHHPAAHEASK